MSQFIEIKNLIYEYKDLDAVNRAIDDITLSFPKGKFIAVLGHNGSGKSTLAKNLNAILKPTSGTVIIDGYDASKAEDTYKIRKKCGMVFQNPDNQIVATIVEDDIAFGAENLGIKSSEIRKRVDEALETVKITEFKYKAPHLLSGGQKQKVAIAGILAMHPDCIILDESTAMLDPKGRQDLMNTVKFLNKNENITVIHITHYMEETVDADYIYIMDSGKIAMQGTPKEIFSQVDKIKSLGLDVPPMTYLSYLLNKEGIIIDKSILTIQEMKDALCQLL